MRALSVAVVGAPYPNKNGSNRASEIKWCSPGEPVELRPEPKNPHDEHAIAVFSCRGVQIGYIASERAVLVGSWLRTGEELVSVFQEEAPWGAVVRIGVGGVPELPRPSNFSPRGSRAPSDADEDPGFWPDPVYDD